MPNQTPSQVLRDPNFYQLPVSERQKVLAQLDPNFAALAPDEQVKVVSQGAPATPNALQRFSQVTLGTQHPLDELRAELGNIYHNPADAAKSAGEFIGIPRELWSDPSLHNILQIGGTGIPGMVFGEHGLIKSPVEFGERVTGANEAAEDARNQNYSAIPGDIAGGLTNLTLLKKPVEAGADVVSDAMRNARASLANVARTPEGRLTPGARAAAWTAGTVAGGLGGHFFGLPGYGELGGAFLGGRGGPLIADALLPDRPEPMKFYDAYSEYEPPEGQVSKLSESPNYENFLASRAALRQSLRNGTPAPSPFGGATSSSNPTGNAPLPAIPEGSPTPFPELQLHNAAPAPQRSLIVDPNSPAPPANITYESVPRPQLFEMARHGDLDALRELRRNPAGFSLPPNSRYLLEPDSGLFSSPVAEEPGTPHGNPTPFGSSGTSSSGLPSRSDLSAPPTRGGLRPNGRAGLAGNPTPQQAPAPAPQPTGMEGFQPGEGTSAARPGQAPRPFSGEDLQYSIDRLRNTLANPAATAEEKDIAARTLQFFGRSVSDETPGERIARVQQARAGGSSQ